MRGDFLLVSDTGSPGPHQLAVTTGLRGLVALEVKVYGPKQDLHSGVHGGALLNPLQALVQACASLHDPQGRVTVPGFYDAVKPPLDWEKEELGKLPITEQEYANFLGSPGFSTPWIFPRWKQSGFVQPLNLMELGEATRERDPKR